MGHGTGDELLVAVAARLSAVVRPRDTAARLGGDEFAILQVGADSQRAEVLAQHVIAVVGFLMLM